MFAALEQNADHDVRIAPRREADEPAVLRQIFGVLALERAFGQGHDLRDAGLPGDINAGNMCGGSCALGQQTRDMASVIKFQPLGSMGTVFTSVKCCAST